MLHIIGLSDYKGVGLMAKRPTSKKIQKRHNSLAFWLFQMKIFMIINRTEQYFFWLLEFWYIFLVPGNAKY